MAFKLFGIHKHWIDSACFKFRKLPTGEKKIAYLSRLIRENEGRCAWSRIPLFFEAKHRTATAKNGGCHPFSASLHHMKPYSDEEGHEIVCYVLNGIKGQLPSSCFRALRKTKAWKDLMARLYDQWQKNPHNTNAIHNIVRS